jgi:hypothetical protein
MSVWIVLIYDDATVPAVEVFASRERAAAYAAQIDATTSRFVDVIERHLWGAQPAAAV